MASKFQDTITIKFEADGNKVVVDAVKALNKATKELISAQANLKAQGDKTIKTQNANRESISKLNIHLKALGKNIKSVGLDSKIYKQAMQGNKVAMEKIRIATKKYTRDLTKNRTTMLGAVHDTRILGGSFAVLRSKLLIASFALVTFIRPLSKMIKTAGDANEILNKFNVVFGRYAGAMRKWASDFGKSIGYAESTLQEFASTFQDTFVPLGFARDESARLSKSLTELAIDVASFSNKMDADVVRDFQSAMVGNHETVRKYGIIIQEANLKTKAYEMGLAEVGEELTNAQKVMARFQLIVEGSTDAIGDKERTLGEYNNQVKAFREQTKKVSEELGRALMPLASTMLELASHFADPTLIKTYTLAISTLGFTYLIASGAVQKFTLALKANKIALIGTGYGVAIIALGELVAMFMRAKEEHNSMSTSINSEIESTALALMEEGDLNKLLKQEEEKLFNARSKLYEEQTVYYRQADNTIKGVVETVEKLHTVDTEGSKRNMKFYQARVDLIQSEINKRKLAIGVIDTSSVALEALNIAYGKTKQGQIDALETNIALIESQLVGVTLTEQQTKGLQDLKDKLDNLKNPVDTIIDSYEEWHEEQEKKNKENIRESGWIQQLIKDDYALAEAMGFVEAKYEATNVLIDRQIEHLEKLAMKKAGMLVDDKDWSEGLITVEIAFSSMSKTAQLFWDNQQTAWEAEMDALKNSDSYKKASSDRQATMEAGLLNKQRSAKQRAFRQQKVLRMAQVVMDTASSIMSIWSEVPKFDFGISAGALSAFVGGLGAVQLRLIASQPVPAFAKGGDFITDRPELIMVGEAGREHVRITPIDRPEDRALKGGDIVLNISAPLVDETVVNSIIPAIEKAQRLNLA